jgi:hypothetical protein
MGLDISHGAFSGAYSAFHRWRVALCQAAGGGFNEARESFYFDDRMNQWPGFRVLMAHSDCGGEMSTADAASCADALETLLPALDAMGDGGGHLARNGGDEPLEFR